MALYNEKCKVLKILIDEVQFETHTNAVLSSTCISRMQLFLSICIKSMMRFCGIGQFSAHTSLKCYSPVFENWCNEMDIIADSHFIFQVGEICVCLHIGCFTAYKFNAIHFMNVSHIERKLQSVHGLRNDYIGLWLYCVLIAPSLCWMYR